MEGDRDAGAGRIGGGRDTGGEGEGSGISKVTETGRKGKKLHNIA